MAIGNTLFVLHNGDPNVWVLVRAGQDSDAYPARFDGVPHNIAAALSNGAYPSQVWSRLEALDPDLLEVLDDEKDDGPPRWEP